MADTFCVMPWIHLIVTTDGTPSACNWMGTRRICKDGAPLSVYRHSLEEIWNAEHMRTIRRAMVQGNRVEACTACYALEDMGGVSLRQQMNVQWREGFANEARHEDTHLKSLAVLNDGCLPTPPSYLELDFGNQCNLKCRMCAGGSSSRIARDPVHNQWAGVSEDPMPPARQWFRRPEIVRGLLRSADHLRELHLLGGEPFLVKEVGDVLQHLIDARVAPRIGLSCHTNATTVRTPWLRLTEHFRSFSIWVSLDGFGPTFEYIRYPAQWEKVVSNVEHLRRLPNADVRAFVGFQAYNALNVVELLRHCDRVGLPFVLYPVMEPAYLRADVLPPPARRRAAARLRAYRDQDCRPEHRWMLDSLLAELGHAGDHCDENALRTFMLFTNDLDVTRGQRFADTHGELLALLRTAGFAWTGQTHHAPRTEGGCTTA